MYTPPPLQGRPHREHPRDHPRLVRFQGKRKMSQNRSAADRAGVAAGLAAGEHPAGRGAAPLVPLPA
jgi:predicted FMN-binding regulatory protein PaiB